MQQNSRIWNITCQERKMLQKHKLQQKSRKGKQAKPQKQHTIDASNSTAENYQLHRTIDIETSKTSNKKTVGQFVHLLQARLKQEFDFNSINCKLWIVLIESSKLILNFVNNYFAHTKIKIQFRHIRTTFRSNFRLSIENTEKRNWIPIESVSTFYC